MFCDLVGSTDLAVELDPEALSGVIRRFNDTCAAVIKHFGGYIGRFMGDGLLVYFGYPQAHEDDAERAVRAGLDIVAKVGQLRFPSGEPLRGAEWALLQDQWSSGRLSAKDRRRSRRFSGKRQIWLLTCNNWQLRTRYSWPRATHCLLGSAFVCAGSRPRRSQGKSRSQSRPGGSSVGASWKAGSRLRDRSGIRVSSAARRN